MSKKLSALNVFQLIQRKMDSLKTNNVINAKFVKASLYQIIQIG
jgi:hypothetical protein